MATYREAGVDLDAADAVVDRIGPAVVRTWGPGVVGGFGGFAAGLRLPDGYDAPVLMMSTDGVGTKAELARRTGRLDGLGYDLVAMCIDDLAAAGARPVAMTDYIAVGTIDVERVATLVRSVAAACEEADVVLLGGETAEHPGVMDADAFDIAGAAVGVVEEGSEIDGRAIEPDDVIIGIASPNLRSNGFSLVRSIIDGQLDLDDPMPGCEGTVADVLLEPSVLYTPAIMTLIDAVAVHGLVHVTGGGLPGNVSRVLPGGCDALIDTDSWIPPGVFASLQQLGNVPGGDMYTTFNMGIGFVAIVTAEDTEAALATLAAAGRPGGVIGRIGTGSGRTRLS